MRSGGVFALKTRTIINALKRLRVNKDNEQLNGNWMLF